MGGVSTRYRIKYKPTRYSTVHKYMNNILSLSLIFINDLWYFFAKIYVSTKIYNFFQSHILLCFSKVDYFYIPETFGPHFGQRSWLLFFPAAHR